MLHVSHSVKVFLLYDFFHLSLPVRLTSMGDMYGLSSGLCTCVCLCVFQRLCTMSAKRGKVLDRNRRD